MPVYVGLDAGGTKTRLRAVDASGQMLYEATSGPANLATSPDDAWRAALAELAAQCPQADYVAGCFAGLLTRADEERAVGELQHLFPDAKVGAWPDYAATVAAAPEDTTAVVIAGTGSVIASMVDGKIVKSGGGGPLLGDVGSAYDIGKQALAILCLQSSPADASEEMWEAIDKAFGSKVPAEIVANFYRSPIKTNKIAELALQVLRDAKNGKDYAMLAVGWATSQLAGIVGLHVKNLPNPPRLASIKLAGGVWGSEYAQKVFTMSLEHFSIGPKSIYDSVKVSRLDLDPVDGAVILARKLAMPQRHEHRSP